ncbi:MAG TPA: ATP-dependent DNA helicase [Saprospiraceae bacterium]|nr:ATP-dependent DNA helicase [Saprospiraceae bacterium]HMP12717.1 ATP-dependent DNA helicase [Saprospiraceae bacterium]
MQDLQQHNQHFLQELARLNPAQREAVDHIEGPVLVIAGPGTGKTQILAARVGRILLETDTLPQNILCLTFTDAGVHAMRRRLLEFIGTEAHRVHIFTFHSFCNGVIQDNLELFGRSHLEPLSDLERVELIRKLIDELDVAHPLKRGRSDVYFYEKHLYELFKLMKTEAWSVEYIQKEIDTYLSDLQNRKEFIYQITRGLFKKGDLKQAKIHDTRERAERLRAAAALYPRYEYQLRQVHRYDYDDMILWVLQAFQENEALLRHYQEQYLYLLVDEYQDTNGAQNKILQQLLAYWESPNIFIVGDDDQSIYEFQGARLKNLQDFYETYQDDLRLIVLQENYRSSQPILDSAKALIQHNKIRITQNLNDLGIEKILQARHPVFGASNLHPLIVTYPNRLQEDVDLVQQIETLRDEGFPLEEVAVIYARHKQVQNIISLLDKKGIPYNTKRRVNILDLPLIRNLRDLLEYLQAEYQQPNSGEYLLFRLLYADFLGLHPMDIAALSVYLAKYTPAERPSLRSIWRKPNIIAELNLETPAAWQRIGDLFDELLRDIRSVSLPALLEKVINRSGLLKMVSEHPDRVWLLQVIKTFFDFVQAEAERQPRLTLRQLLDMLHKMDANHLAIGIQKVTTAAHGVHLLTAHSAKGLEFERVFVLDCTKDYWEPGGRNNAYRFPLPDTLTFSGEEDALEARRRLFYVAVTRSKAQLCLSYSEQDNAGKPLQRAVFIDEVTTGSGISVVQRQLPEDTMVTAHLLNLSAGSPPTIDLPGSQVITELLEGFVLSISVLNRYLDCPLSFYFEHVLRAPVLPSESASYGLAMHQALRRFFEKMLLSKNKSFPEIAVLLRLFEEEMERLRGNFSQREWERRLELGRRHLPAYYRQEIGTWAPNVRVEYTIRQTQLEGVPITGTIDRLDLHEQLSATIVDYKTGKADPVRLRRPNAKLPHGGSYWRQLVFYKMLYDSAERSSRRATAGRITWLDPDSKGHFPSQTMELSSSDAAFMRELVQETYAKIMQHEFYEGCGKPNCAWCNFVRHNAAVDSFATEIMETLDDSN